MRKKMYSTVVIVFAIIGVCLTVIGYGVTMGSAVKKAMSSVLTEFESETDVFEEYEDGEHLPEHEYTEKDLEGVDPATEALADIPTYEAEGTTVSYVADGYQLRKQMNKNGVVLLDVKYPVLSGLSEEHADTINNIIKDQAMVSADNYYLNVEGRSKLTPGSDGVTYIISEVSYQVTYLSDDFISVVFEDCYCAGDYSMQYIDMRSCNINLKTGESYELSQIVNANEKLAEDFQEKLDDKYQYNDVIYGIDTEEYESMLSGEKEQDDSFMGYYRTEDGIQMYVSFHYFTQESSLVGWLTAPYSLEDLKPYQADSEFWNNAQ